MEEKQYQDNSEQRYTDLIEKQKDEIYDFKEELNGFKSRLEYHKRDTEILKSLYGQGIIDIDGNPVDRKSLYILRFHEIKLMGWWISQLFIFVCKFNVITVKPFVEPPLNKRDPFDFGRETWQRV